MPNRLNVRSLVLVSLVSVSVLALVGVVYAVPDTGNLDLEVANNTLYKSGFTSQGAFVEYLGDANTTFGSSGTGTFNSFVRLQGSPTESGYNTNGNLQFDTKSGTWTHAIKVSEIPVIDLNGQPAWELFADLNEANNDKQVSLDDLEVWFTTNANLTGYSFGAGATQVYDFSGTIKINDVNQGSGRGDLRYSIPLSLVSGGVPAGCEYGSATCNTYFLLHTKFGGNGSAPYDSEGGFEEWKVKKYPTLQIIKNTVGGNATFNFTVNGPTASTPSITTVNGVGATTNNIVSAGTYQITEGSTLGWEFQSASCSTNGGTATAYTPGSNISVANEDSHVVCTFTNSKLQPLQVTKTANTAYNKTWNWTIEKTATPTTHELFDGESASSDYAVTVTKTGSTNSGYAVTGTITIHNPNFSTVAVVNGVSDVLSDATGASVDCGGAFPLNVAPGADLVCSYTANPAGTTSNLNTATVTTDGNVPGGSDDAVVDWTSATVTEINGTVSVNDTFDSGDFGPVSTTTTHNYSEEFTCGSGEGQYTGTGNIVPNTATIVGGSSDDASVTVNCYTPTVSKTALPAIDQTYTWTIDKSVTPASWSLFDGDTGTSEYTVSVVKTLASTVYSVSGNITITNPAPKVLAVDSVTDVVSGPVVATVNCPASVVSANASLVCTYSTTLPNGDARTNTATADFAGDVVDASGNASVDFAGVVPTIFGGSVTVDDTNGSSWNFADSGSVNYDKTFDCSGVDWENSNNYVHNNTATIVGGLSDSAAVTVTCYKLGVEKTAVTSFDRDHNWEITKVGKDAEGNPVTDLDLAVDQSYLADYTVTVDTTGYVDSNWAVAGTITVSNPHPYNSAVITSWSDIMTGDIVGVIDLNSCVSSLGSTPSLILVGGSVTCSYASALPNADERLNTATVVQQNNDLDQDFVATPSDVTTSYSATADVEFGNPANETDTSVDVTDTLGGVLGTVNVTDSLPATFDYDYEVGLVVVGECGVDKVVENTASYSSVDGEEGDASWTITVHTECPANSCTLTQGYWKTHNDSFHGGAPTDNNWENLLDWDVDTYQEKEGESFFLSGNTWFGVFWTAPKGNVYYNLAHQWMAAKLNVLNGASTTPAVATALADAQALLSTKTPAYTLGLKGKNGNAEKQVWTNLAGVLGSYNEGLIGPGHCDEDGNSSN